MLDAVPCEEVLAAIDRMVTDLLRAEGIAGPPVDAIPVAREHFGLEICFDDQPKRTKSTEGKRIILRSADTEEHRQWTVALAIGRHVKPDLLQRLDASGAGSIGGESLAGLFAYHLLVPTVWFAEDAPKLEYDLLELKKRYATASHEVIAWRFLDLPEPCIITIIDNDRIARRRGNAWPTRRRLEPAEEKCRRFVHDKNRPRTVCENGWTVHGWPIPLETGQREILRSLVDWDEGAGSLPRERGEVAE